MDKTIGNQLKKILIILLINFIFSVGGDNPWSIFNVSSNANDLTLARANLSEGTKGFYQFTNPALLSKTLYTLLSDVLKKKVPSYIFEAEDAVVFVELILSSYIS